MVIPAGTSVGDVTHEIPVIDIGPFLAGGDGQAAADAIEAAATQVGFFQVINHGVPGELLDAVYAAAYEFSDLPADVKLRAASPHPYRGVHLRPDQQGAIRFERFLAARYDNADAAIAAGIAPEFADYYYPNEWPAEPSTFRPAVEALFAATMAEQVTMGLDEHDRLIAYVLGLSHAVNIAFFTALAGSGEAAPRLARLSSTTFDAQLDVATRVAQENPDLYFDIQRLNDFGAAPLAALANAVDTLRRAVAADAGVVEADAHLREARVKIILHILRVEALVRDRVAEENERVAVLEVDVVHDRLRIEGGRGRLLRERGKWQSEEEEGAFHVAV